MPADIVDLDVERARRLPIFLAGPAEITEPGRYRLASDFAHLTKGIEIVADDVDLDLGGHVVRCGQSDERRPSAVTTGVLVYGKRVSIHNGAVTGFWRGIHADGADALVVHDVDLSGNTYIGLSVSGTGVRIFGNTFADIGGYRLEAYAVGINALTTKGWIYGNVFRNIYRQENSDPQLMGEGVAVLLGTGARDNFVRNNWIDNDEVRRDTIGIWGGRGGKARISQNCVTNFRRAICGGTYVGSPVTVDNNRLLLRSAIADSIAICADFGDSFDNLVLGFETSHLGAIAGGDVPRCA
jgi:hypothetical protein